jgi:diguanylate cyclase (GGDEF)-like protein
VIVLYQQEPHWPAGSILEAGAVDRIRVDQINGPLLERVVHFAVERSRIAARLRHGAFHDPLTGLPNRVMFLDRLREAIARVHESPDQAFAVLFLDLDRFKVINDSLGHLVGDQLLIAVAQQLRRCTRPGDLVARLGGDEFTILLEPIQAVSDATTVADRLARELQRPLELAGHEVYVSGSIGVALSTYGYDSPEDLLRDADTAMYQAKAQGKARYTLFDPGMHAQAMALWQQETELRRAVAQQQFQLVYQPLVALATGRIAGVEALVRWQHPQRGLVPPADFLALAEETGLINGIGSWVLREACRQARSWQQACPMEPPLTVTVNLSGTELLQPDLMGRIDEVLHATGFDAHCLKLDIAETTATDHIESVTALLLRIRFPSIAVAVDDFRGGAGVLPCLGRYPIDALKIDASVVAGLPEDGEKQERVRAIVALARASGLAVVAKGVETLEQLECLRTLGCDMVQGYLTGRPVDAETLGTRLAAEHVGAGEALALAMPARNSVRKSPPSHHL